jgi:hypothetical protein
MATNVLLNKYNLAESLRRTAPDGSSLAIAQVLDQVNDFMKVMPTFEANGINEHKEAETATEPTGDWVDYNEGVSRGASSTKVNKFPIAMLKKFNTPDWELIMDSADPEGKRMQEGAATIKGMVKQVADALIYGDRGTDTKKLTGIAPYLTNLNNSNVVDGGGSGSDLTSMYAVAPGPDTVFMVHPKGNPSVGVEHTDHGVDFLQNSTTGKDQKVFRDEFAFKAGLVVKDRRALGRYANIESSGSSNIFDEDKIITLHYQMLEHSDGLFYLANRTLLTQLHIRAKDKNNVLLSIEEFEGRRILTLLGRPILLHDKIVDTESAVVAS